MINLAGMYVYRDFLIKRLNRMYCLRKLNFFRFDVKKLALFYDFVIENVRRYCLLCWGGNASKGDRQRVERIVKESGRIIGVSRRDFGSVYTDLLSFIMFRMMRVIHFTIAFQVSWLPDQGACAYPLPWPAGVFLDSFLRQFGITMSIVKGVMFQLEL